MVPLMPQKTDGRMVTLSHPAQPPEGRLLADSALFSSDPGKSFTLSVDLFSNLEKQELMDQICP